MGLPSGPAMVTDAVPVPVHSTVTITWVDVDLTLKLKDGEVVTVTVKVAVWVREPLVAVTTTGNVPEVVISVGTVSVDVVEYGEEIEVGLTVQVTLGGQPEVTESETVPANPPPATTDKVLNAVPPAPMLCIVGEALSVKSAGGGAVVALNVAIHPTQYVGPVVKVVLLLAIPVAETIFSRYALDSAPLSRAPSSSVNWLPVGVVCE